MAFTAMNKQPATTRASVPVVASVPAKVAHPPEIDTAFARDHELRKRVHAAIDQNPSQSTLFRDISTFILDQATKPTATDREIAAEPPTKKRRIEDNVPANGAQLASDGLFNGTVKAWRTYTGVSFSLPQRKKFTLELVDGKAGGIRAVGASGNTEFGIACKDIDQVFCLPVPEKAKKQHNFIIIPRHGDGVNSVPDNLKGAPPEPILWTFEEATGKNIVEGEDPGPGQMAEAIHHCLIQASTGKEVVFPNVDNFSSAIPESHRKNEKAYHVKAHRGSKEGYLFFLSTGIIYGFKKPLALFSFDSISSISYTAVLRNTFNLVIATPSGQEIEFGMLDQADFAGINEYVQKNGLQDGSMAATRRAKKLNVNPPKKEDPSAENGTAGGEEEESELQKAERELQDAEDEEEEDYDPGSEGDSDGSGEDSEEDGDDGGDAGDDVEEIEGEDGDEEMEQ